MVRILEFSGLESYGADDGGLGCGIGDLVSGEGGQDWRERFLGCATFQGICCAGTRVGRGGYGEEGGGGEGVAAGLEVNGGEGECCGEEERQRCGSGGGGEHGRI